MKSNKIYLFGLCLSICMLWSSCRPDRGIFQQYTHIQTLKDYPENYQTPFSAKIKATVLATTDILGISACKVNDTTGSIYLVSTKGYREGDKIIVKGHIENLLGKSSWKVLVFYEDEAPTR